MKYDFCGWATKNDLVCADGLTIKQDAFKENDGKKVPLVWGHRHESVENVLGHAILKNKKNGVFAYCTFNKTPAAVAAKEAVAHGDVTSLSIFANNLVREGSDIVHGVIREVSLVLAGANPGAFIESVVAHGEPMDIEEDECICYTGNDIFVSTGEENIQHAAKDKEDEDEDDDMDEESVAEVIDSLSNKQKMAVGILLEQAAGENKKQTSKEEKNDEEDEDDNKKKKKEGGSEMKHHNLFEGQKDDGKEKGYLSHDLMRKIVADAKKNGSLKDTVTVYIESGELAHAIPTTGMTTATGTQTYGVRDMEMLFPDYKAPEGLQPEFINRNMGWVERIMSKVHNIPFSRIKSLYADLTEEDARARGYIKGKMKKEEFFTILKRTTDPQTIYKKQKLDREDIIDITDFDVVVWIKAEMRLMLNEELARAFLLGDGRPTDSDDKIKEDHIRPVSKDVDLFTVKASVAGSTPAEIAKNFIDECVRSRKKYKGSGNPDLFTTEDLLGEMLLLENKNGDKIYKTEEELKTTLRVDTIQTVELMEGTTIDNAEMLGIIVNFADYRVGTNKGGEVNMFEDFDIDFNQQKYLMETRCSGALVKPFSAIVLTKAGASSASYSAGRESSK